MMRVYRMRMRVKPEQAEGMHETLETLRRLYNAALQQRTCAWQEEQRSVTLAEQKKWLTGLRHSDPDLARVNCGNAQQALMTLDLAFQAFFRRVKQGETPGYPKPVRPGEWRTCKYHRMGNGCKWYPDKHQNYFQHIGMCRLIGWQKHPVPPTAEIRTAAWTKQADGYYLILTIRVPDTAAAASSKPPLGLALNLFPFFTTSEGQKQVPAWPLEKSLKQLARKQARLIWQANAATLPEGEARRIPRVFDKYPPRDPEQPESRNLQKRRAEFARLHQHVQDQRREWLILTARRLLSEHGLIAVEEIPVARLLQAEKGIGESIINRRICDNAWSRFIQILQQQAPKFGAQVVLVKPLPTGGYSSQEEKARLVLAAALKQNSAG